MIIGLFRTIAQNACRGVRRIAFEACLRAPVLSLVVMLAADRLLRTDDPLARTARSLGYESENSFNTAFKRVMGISPRRYARGGPSAPLDHTVSSD